MVLPAGFHIPVSGSVGLGNIYPGEADYVAGPVGTLAQTATGAGGNAKRPPGLIFAHGSGNPTMVTLAQIQSQGLLIRQLAQFFTVFVTDLGNESGGWGSDTHVSRILNVCTIGETYYGITGKWAIVSASMGTTGAMNFALRYPSKVASIGAVIPCLDLWDMKLNRGYGGQVDSAYGGNYQESVHGATHNPVTFANQLDTTIPMKLFASPQDAITVDSTVQAFRAGRPATMYQDIGTNGHSEASIIAATPGCVDFVRGYYF